MKKEIQDIKDLVTAHKVAEIAVALGTVNLHCWYRGKKENVRAYIPRFAELVVAQGRVKEFLAWSKYAYKNYSKLTCEEQRKISAKWGRKK